MRVRNRSAIGAAVVVMLAVHTAAGSAQRGLDYVQWRGPLRDGGAAGFVEPTSWPRSLTRHWRVSLGEGYATPLIVGNRVYTFTRQNGREVVTAFDAKTGTEAWHADYAADYTPSRPAAAHGAGPKATPVFHEGKLFTLGVSGILSAFDTVTHKLLWQTPAPREAPFFSAASSPLVENGLVIAHPGNYEPLTAFDAKTGAVRWTVGAAGLFASPIAATLEDVRQIITTTQDSVIGVSLAGELLWRHPWEGGGGSTTPVVHNGMVIVSALDKGIAAIRPTRQDKSWRVEAVWHTREVSMYVSNPVVIADTVFGLSHRNRGQYFAVNAANGDVLWLGPPRQAENAALVKAGPLLFLLQPDAALIVVRASRSEYTPIARYTIADGATWAQPAISGNRFFIKDASSLAMWSIDRD